MAHTLHPEAIDRHRTYIATARRELRKESRNKLHKLLEGFTHADTGAKRRLPVEMCDNQFAKKLKGELRLSQIHAPSPNTQPAYQGKSSLDPFMPPIYDCRSSRAIDEYAAVCVEQWTTENTMKTSISYLMSLPPTDNAINALQTLGFYWEADAEIGQCALESFHDIGTEEGLLFYQKNFLNNNVSVDWEASTGVG